MMQKSFHKKKIRLGILLLFLLLAVSAFDWRLTTKVYSISSPKITKEIRIGLVTDLHSCDYGPDQKTLMDAIAASSPDILLLGGDIIDDKLPAQKAKEFLLAASDLYPTYYVTGNHEYWTGDIEGIRALVRSYGIPILAGDCISMELCGQKVELCGIDDWDEGPSSWYGQLDNCGKQIQSSSSHSFSILLTHRPEKILDYAKHSFDLVLAGHAHGGQWILPGFIPGVFAPDQGFFPKYAGGKYTLSPHTFMIVSRGLARESTRIPRIFNPPEYVVVELKPAK